MIYEVLYLFLLFIIYSMIGYLAEVFFIFIMDKKLTFNRGFLIGPYIPIYGVSIICMVRLLSPYKDDLLVLFIMSTVACTVIEYVTSYIMEKMFKLRWWDYSHLSFNINGRVCLMVSFLFGLGSIFITKIVNPLIEGCLTKVPHWLIILISLIILIIFIADIIISYIAVINIKIEAKKYDRTDATETIKTEIEDYLHSHNFISNQIKRLFNAFPDVKSLKYINFKDYKKLVAKLKNTHKKNKIDK